MTTATGGAIVDAMPDLNIPNVPARHLKRLHAEGKKRGVGMSTIVCEAVADAFPGDEMMVPMSVFGGGARSPDSRLIVTVPDSVRDVLRREGPGKGSTIRAVVINTLAARYGLARVPEARQRSVA